MHAVIQMGEITKQLTTFTCSLCISIQKPTIRIKIKVSSYVSICQKDEEDENPQVPIRKYTSEYT